MNAVKQTVIDTVHVFAAMMIVAMLFTMVIARAEPDWQSFALISAAVLIVSRLLGWACQRFWHSEAERDCIAAKGN